MPNDDPTLSTTPNDPTPVEPVAPAAPVAPAPAPGFDPSSIEETLGSVVNAIQGLQGRLDGIEQQTAPPPPSPSDVSADADAVIQQFTEDPGGTIDARAAAAAEKVILEKMGPGMTRDLQNRRDLFLQSEGTRVNARFGEGFYEEKIAPLLVTKDPNKPGRLENLNLWLQADPEAIRGVIDGVVGQQFMGDNTHGDLMDRYNKSRTSRENAQPPPNLMGPGIAASPAQLQEGRLSPDHKAQVERIQEAGFGDFNEDTIRTMKGAGKTLSGYLAATKGAQ